MRFPASAVPARVLDAEAESESRSRRGTLWRGDADPSRSPPAIAGSALNALDVPGKLRRVKTSVIVDEAGPAKDKRRRSFGESGLGSGSLSARFMTHVGTIDSGPGLRGNAKTTHSRLTAVLELCKSTRWKNSSTVQYRTPFYGGLIRA